MTNYDKEFVELCKFKVPDTIRLLIDNGVDPTYNGGEAMINACRYGNTEIIDILFETGKFTNLDDYLYEAIRVGGVRIVKQLIGYGAKFSKDNEDVVYSLFDEEFKDDDLKYLVEETNMFEVLDPNKIFSEYFRYNEITRDALSFFPVESIEKDAIINNIITRLNVDPFIFEELSCWLEPDDMRTIFDSRFRYINNFNTFCDFIDKLIELGYEITDENISNALASSNIAETFIRFIERYDLFERAKELLKEQILSSKVSERRVKLIKYFDLSSE